MTVHFMYGASVEFARENIYSKVTFTKCPSF